MAENIFKLIDSAFYRSLEQDVVTSIVVALRQKDKVVTAKTARSVRAETIFEEKDVVSVNGYGSEGMKFIIDGKEAGTKLPVKKVGKRFELVQNLKDWKAIRGFKGSDYILARTIADNPRAPVDIGGEAVKILQRLTSAKIAKRVGRRTIVEIRKIYESEIII